jgi:hypothetical protein
MRSCLFVVFVFMLVFLVGAEDAAALDPYVQFDILVNRPMTISAADLEGEYESVKDVNEFLLKYPVIIPDLRGHVFVDQGPARIGIGMRGLTALIQTVLWPTVTTEFDLGPVRLTGSLGGGMYGLTGLVNRVEFAGLWLPEITAAYMFTDWFHAGLGGTAVYYPEVDSGTIGFVGCIFARFSLGGKD